MPEHFDVVVLGGGPGGYAAALFAAGAGKSVALVEEAGLGGTCLHRGCIPAKELLQSAEVFRTVKGAGAFGVEVNEPTLNLGDAQERKSAVVARLAKGVSGLLAGRSVKIVPGRGVVSDAATRRVSVSDGSELEADALILATGSQPRFLAGIEIDGHRVLSSDHVLELTEVPGRVVIIGGGAIGVEFASMLSDFGSQVTLLEGEERIIPGTDVDVSAALARAFKKRGITTKTSVVVAGVESTADEVKVHYTDATGDHHEVADQVIVSVGRTPRTADIGLEGSGIEIDEQGHVRVDEAMRTSIAGVYAVGDIVATPQLAHVGFAEAQVAVEAITGAQVHPIDYDKVPWGIYCHPEVAFAGLTEVGARERGIDVVVGTQRFIGNSRAQILGEADGMIKVVAERGGAILGVHMVGPWVTELIGEGYLAVNFSVPLDDLSLMIHAHPTLSEVLGETLLALTGRTLHG